MYEPCERNFCEDGRIKDTVWRNFVHAVTVNDAAASAMFVHVIISASLILLCLLGTCRCTVELVLVYRSRVVIFWHSKVVTPEFFNKIFFCIGAQLSNITTMITISTTSILYMYSTMRVVRSMKLVSEVDICRWHFRIRSLRVAPLCWGVQETVIREKPAAKRQGNYHSTTSHSEIARRRGSRVCKVHTDLWILFVIKILKNELLIAYDLP